MSNPRVEHVRARYIRTRQRIKRHGWYLRDGAFVFFSRRRPSPYRVLQVVVHFRDGVPYRGEVEEIPAFMAPWWVRQPQKGANA